MLYTDTAESVAGESLEASSSLNLAAVIRGGANVGDCLEIIYYASYWREPVAALAVVRVDTS
jgi:hypothetical protein